jgi:hypothetical protein
VAFALVSLLSACSSEAPAPQSRTGLGANDNQTDQVLESVRLFEAFAPSNATNSSPTMSANEDRS